MSVTAAAFALIAFALALFACVGGLLALFYWNETRDAVETLEQQRAREASYYRNMNRQSRR